MRTPKEIRGYLRGRMWSRNFRENVRMYAEKAGYPKEYAEDVIEGRLWIHTFDTFDWDSTMEGGLFWQNLREEFAEWFNGK